MISYKHLKTASSLLQKAAGLTCSADTTLTGHRAISTGVTSKQRRNEGALHPMYRDVDNGVRRKFVQKTDFAHPKGLRSSIPPIPKSRQSFVDKDDEDLSLIQQPFTKECTDEDHEKPTAQNIAFRGLDGDFPCTGNGKPTGPEPEYHKVVTGFKEFHYTDKFSLTHRKGVLPGFTMAYETWGELNEQKDNAVFLHTGLSASSHAKSHEDNLSAGWWEKFIGPGCALDTNKFFIVCANNLGSCYGSTGPSSINPLTEKPYGTTFPLITVEDMVRAKFLLLDHLGINKLYASIGSSLGGMQSLTASVLFPERVERLISISGTAQTHPSTIALRYLQRKAIMMDPDWNNGNYYNTDKFPITGMKLAREIATITYRSGPEWDDRFGRRRIDDGEPSLCPSFQIENYIDHQGQTFATKYDPNSLLYISKAMDLFDLSELFGDMHSALSRIKCPVMIIGVKTDALIPIWQQRELAQQLQAAGNNQVTFYELNSIYGHDTFLLDLNGVGSGVKGFLETELKERGRAMQQKDRK